MPLQIHLTNVTAYINGEKAGYDILDPGDHAPVAEMMPWTVGAQMTWSVGRWNLGRFFGGMLDDMRAKIVTLNPSAKAPCFPEDDYKPVKYQFTIDRYRLAMPAAVLGYSLLIASTGIVKSL